MGILAARWIVFGWTSTGKHIAVVFEILCDDPYYVKPFTAYEAPEYGGGELPRMELNASREDRT